MVSDRPDRGSMQITAILADICRVLFWLCTQRTPPAHVAEAIARLKFLTQEPKINEPPTTNPSQFRDGTRQWGPAGGLFEVQDGEWREVKT